MSKQEKWIPSDEEINAACNEDDHPDYMPGLLSFVTNCDLIRALIRAAVEKALAEQMEDLEIKLCPEDVGIEEYVAHLRKKLAEQEARFTKTVEIANETYKKQEARHKREVIEARIEEIGKGLHVLQSGGVVSGEAHEPEFKASHCVFCRNIGILRAELAALEVKP